MVVFLGVCVGVKWGVFIWFGLILFIYFLFHITLLDSNGIP